MALYDREIAQLKQQLASLQEIKKGLDKLIAITTDPVVKKVYIDDRADVIDKIDEVLKAVDILEHKKTGSPNGYDKHADEVDWTDPNNWPDIRKVFGFDEDDEPNN